MAKKRNGTNSEVLVPAPGTTPTNLMPCPQNRSKPTFPYKDSSTTVSSDVMGAALVGDIYNYPRRLEKHRQALTKMRNGQPTLAFLER